MQGTVVQTKYKLFPSTHNDNIWIQISRFHIAQLLFSSNLMKWVRKVKMRTKKVRAALDT